MIKRQSFRQKAALYSEGRVGCGFYTFILLPLGIVFGILGVIALLASSLANFSYVDVNSENIVTAIFMAILGVVSVVLRVLVFSDIRGLSPAAYPKILGLLNYEFAIAVIQGVTLAVSLSGEGSVLAESWIPILGAVLFVLLYFLSGISQTAFISVNAGSYSSFPLTRRSRRRTSAARSFQWKLMRA